MSSKKFLSAKMLFVLAAVVHLSRSELNNEIESPTTTPTPSNRQCVQYEPCSVQEVDQQCGDGCYCDLSEYGYYRCYFYRDSVNETTSNLKTRN
uniref:Putative secreted protein n=1 Tax=Ixodes ricinus TaxID=34613 RepID=A0A6B0UHG4_IXORI